MSLETTYQNDFKPYNLRYGFLPYLNNKQQSQHQQQAGPYNWLSQCSSDIPWRRHVAAINTNDPNSSVEWISTPSTQYIESEFYKSDQPQLDWMMKKCFEKERTESAKASQNEFYHKVRFSPWQFIYPEDAKIVQTQGEFFQRANPFSAQSVKY